MVAKAYRRDMAPETMAQYVRQTVAGMSVLLLVALVPQAGYAGSPKVDAYSKVPEAEKISLDLLRLEQEMRQKHLSLSRAAAGSAVRTEGDSLRLDILTSHLNANVEAELVQTGVQILHISRAHRRVSVLVDDPFVMHALAQIPEVVMISPDYGAAVNSGSVDGRASEAMQVDIAKLVTPLDGSGQVIGILSDSFARRSGVRDSSTTPPSGVAGVLKNSRPQQTGDLPSTVTLLNDVISGTDEGAAMAELVHDIAPGADIVFHTAFTGQSGFADGITELCTTAGSTVVVDDVIYFAEPMYQDGIIAQAAAACVAAGVPFFSSAGNNSNRGFRQVFVDIAPADDQATTPTGNDLHDWKNGDGFLDVTLPSGGSMRVVLQWNQPFASVSFGKGSEIDLDLFVTATPDAAGLASPLARSNNLQGISGAPRGDAVEIISYVNTSSQPRTVYLAVEHFRGSQGMIPQEPTTPLEFRLVFFENNASATQIQGITNGSSAFGGPTMYGHAVADGVVSVGAVPWYDTSVFNPNFESSAKTDPESFSSRGGTMSIQFDANGDFALRTSFEPDIAAVDGNNTTFFGSLLSLGGLFSEPDGFPNFFGTSAAAPNAAAVAALLLELNGGLTPDDITTVLADTALDITGFRASVGRDDVTGAGLIDANAAIGSVMQGPSSFINSPAGNLTITQGAAVTFSGTGSSQVGGGPLTFLWDFGGGAPPSTFEDPGSVTFHTIGTFKVTFTVTDSQGVADETPAMVTISVVAAGSDPTPDPEPTPDPGPTPDPEPMPDPEPTPGPGPTPDPEPTPDPTPNPVAASNGGGGGGGCSLHPGGANDFTLVIALLSVLAYLGWKRSRVKVVC